MCTATHPDLVNQLATNAGETGTDSLGRDKRSNGVDDDGNGYRDDWHGWDFVSENAGLGVSEGDSSAGPDNDPQDNHGHGTHVAGTIAAQKDNDEGIAGVAPGAKIMSLRGLGANGRGSSLAIAEAFDYAGKMGLRIVNASLGGPGLDQSQLAAVQAHPNTLYVIAAGNDNVNVDATAYGPCALPAANVLCVGASDVNDNRASFSNYGANNVDVFAPGTSILSTYTSPAYAYLQGTSMATPNTAGVAALVLSAGPAASALDVKSAIMASTDAKPDLSGKSVTGGRVNAERAVSGVVGGAPKNVTPPAITGTPRQATALSASTGTWSPAGASYSYVWERSFDGGATWTAIAGATASTYTPGASDIGTRLRVTVTATNPYGVASASSAAVGPVASGAPVATSPPVINGVLRRGQVLTIGGAWNPAGTSYSYQWQRSTDGGITWTTIGSDSSSYTLTAADREARVRVDGHGDQRLRADDGDQRPGRAGPLVSAHQHDAAGPQRHDAAELHAERRAGHVGRDREHLHLPLAARRRHRLDGDQRRDRLDLPARQGGRGRARPRARDGHQRGRDLRAGQRRERRADLPVPAGQHRRAGHQRHGRSAAGR